MPGMPSVAIESRKHAASRPRPPLPRPASGSCSIISRGSIPCFRQSRLQSGSSNRFVMLFIRERPIRNSSDRWYTRFAFRAWYVCSA